MYDRQLSQDSDNVTHALGQEDDEDDEDVDDH